MRIVLTGGGTGGHFYPLMAVAESVYEKAEEQKLLHDPEFYYLAPTPYNKDYLNKYDIEFRSITAGKQRTYASLKNFLGLFKTAWGILQSLWTVFAIYPDVVFAKGGYASFPVLVAARILRIPVVIHESDSVPGRVNRWAGNFAVQVAISFPDAAEYFPDNKVALTGNPIRSEIARPALSGAREYLDIEEDVPVIFVIGGSQGSKTINSVLLDAMPELLENYYVIHQTGSENMTAVEQSTEFLFSELPRHKQSLKERYKPFGFLDAVALRMAAGAADIVISRAGSTIFEIAAWAVPSILIPLDESHADHQRKNAYAYARTGAAEVIEENNISDNILMSEIDKIMNNSDIYKKMTQAAADFARLDAAEIIAGELLHIGQKHKE